MPVAPVFNVMNLRTLVDRVEPATSDDPFRKAINCVFLERDPKVSVSRVAAIATNGHRLHVAYGEVPGLPVPEAGLLLTDAARAELRKLLHRKARSFRGQGSTGSMCLHGHGFELHVPERGSVTLATPLDARGAPLTFPNWRQVVPKRPKTGWKLPPKETSEALRAFADVGAHSVSVDLASQTATIGFERKLSNGSVVGRATVPVERIGPAAKPTFHVDPTYLADALEHVPGPVLYSTGKPHDPLLIAPADPQVTDFAVVMPQ